ncbi:MAG: hypothetical protein PHO02_05980 [Candidatus Nanoarchaeia archaeon]|nr:hypothetical protein [Candidatus Nanoarchaeia archaeon]
MKKRLFCILIAVLLLMQCAFAYVTISSTPRDKYNIGESFQAAGTVSSEEGMTGFIRTGVECNGEVFPSSLVPVSISAGAKINIPSQTAVPPVMFTSSMEGICSIRIGLVEAGVEHDYALSKEFEVVKELKAAFRVEEKNLQAGVPLRITGAIALMNLEPITGVAEIYNVLGGTRYLVSVIPVDKGNFSFTYPTKGMPAGAYTIEVLARDMYGNEQLFEAASYTLSDKLHLSASPGKADYLPGEEAAITGELRDVHNALVQDALAYVSFEGTETAVRVVDGKLKHNLLIPESIKSGKHTVSISASDNLGNSGAASVEIFVVPVATSLRVEMENAEAKPMGSVGIVPRLLDQAGDLIEADVDIEISDAKGRDVVGGKYASGRKMLYEIQQYAPPGEWEVSARHGKLSSKTLFSVSEVKDIKIEVSGTRVLFTNTGNVKWKDNAGMELNGVNGIFTDRMTSNINPGETFVVDLGKQAPTGGYTLTVTLPDRAETFYEFGIPDGKNVYNLNIVYIIMLLLVAGLIAYETTLLLKKGRRMTPKLDHDDLRRLSRKAVSSVDAENAAAREKQRLVDDYKRMTLEEIKKTENAMKPMYPDKPWRRRVERKPSAPQKKDEGNAGGAASFFGGF